MGGAENSNFLTNRCFIRYFHSSPELLGRRKNDEPVGFKSRKPKNGKFKKRPTSNKPPVESPYGPPKLKRDAKKSLPDKTIEIFEGMITVELAKCSGESISTVQNILVNVGEKIDSDFDPPSVDLLSWLQW